MVGPHPLLSANVTGFCPKPNPFFNLVINHAHAMAGLDYDNGGGEDEMKHDDLCHFWLFF